MREPKRGKQFVNEIKEFTISDGAIVVWHLNQFGYAVKSRGVTFFIDPYLSDDLVNATKGRPDQHTKIFEPLLRGSDIDHADYVICTHDHLDHFDHTTVKEISEANERTKFILPLQAKRSMDQLKIDASRIIYVQADETLKLPEMEIRAFKGMHETFDYDKEYGYAYLGFHISLDGYHLYHSGDTILFDELVEEVKKYPIDLAFLPINGREYQKLHKGIRGNMNFKEAADFAVEINADIVIPGHWGMHVENTERAGHFVDYITEKYRFQKVRIMVPGDRFIYIK